MKLKQNETHQTADLENKIAERRRRQQLALRQDYENKRMQQLKVGDLVWYLWGEVPYISTCQKHRFRASDWLKVGILPQKYRALQMSAFLSRGPKI